MKVTEIVDPLDGVEPWAGEVPAPADLVRLRQGAGLSRERLAHLGGVATDTVGRYEKGETSAPRSLSSEGFRRALTFLYRDAARRRAQRAEERKLEAYGA